MKTQIVFIAFSLFLSSCQQEASQNEASENIWKKRTTNDTNIARADGSDATNAPIDGGLSVLLLTGALYGGKRLYKNKKALRA